MSPEELEGITVYLREQLAQAGVVRDRIEDEPLLMLARFVHTQRLALAPFNLSIAYRAIAYVMEQE
jgi:hypothetical protein